MFERLLRRNITLVRSGESKYFPSIMTALASVPTLKLAPVIPKVSSDLRRLVLASHLSLCAQMLDDTMVTVSRCLPSPDKALTEHLWESLVLFVEGKGVIHQPQTAYGVLLRLEYIGYAKDVSHHQVVCDYFVKNFVSLAKTNPLGILRWEMFLSLLVRLGYPEPSEPVQESLRLIALEEPQKDRERRTVVVEESQERYRMECIVAILSAYPSASAYAESIKLHVMPIIIRKLTTKDANIASEDLALLGKLATLNCLGGKELRFVAFSLLKARRFDEKIFATFVTHNQDALVAAAWVAQSGSLDIAFPYPSHRTAPIVDRDAKERVTLRVKKCVACILSSHPALLPSVGNLLEALYVLNRADLVSFPLSSVHRYCEALLEELVRKVGAADYGVRPAIDVMYVMRLYNSLKHTLLCQRPTEFRAKFMDRVVVPIVRKALQLNYHHSEGLPSGLLLLDVLGVVRKKPSAFTREETMKLLEELSASCAQMALTAIGTYGACAAWFLTNRMGLRRLSPLFPFFVRWSLQPYSMSLKRRVDALSILTTLLPGDGRYSRSEVEALQVHFTKLFLEDLRLDINQQRQKVAPRVLYAITISAARAGVCDVRFLEALCHHLLDASLAGLEAVHIANLICALCRLRFVQSRLLTVLVVRLHAVEGGIARYGKRVVSFLKTL